MIGMNLITRLETKNQRKMNLYRYRPYKSNENGVNYDKTGLINSEIYFSELTELNDPIEGFKDVYFQGDFVIWKNFFKNYIRALLESFFYAFLSENIAESCFIPIYHVKDKYFDELYEKPWFQKIPTLFVSHPFVSSFIKKLCGKKITEEQLLFFMQILHPFALDIAFQDFIDNNLVKEAPVFIKDQINNIEKIGLSALFSTVNQNSGWFVSELNNIMETLFLFLDNNSKNNNKFLFFDYPKLFVSKIKDIMYPPFYVACFTNDPNNSSMWGNYANSHKGICLKFNCDGNLPLLVPYSWDNRTGMKKGFIPHSIQDIKYSNDLISLNFFENMGNISDAILARLWLVDSDTKQLTSVKTINDETRDRHWKYIYDSLSQKTKDWEKEQETRILLTSHLFDLSRKEDRCIKYKFNCLDGIIFGMKTSDFDKNEIIKIIMDKCKNENRTNFNFYQEYYDKEKRCMSYKEVPVGAFLQIKNKQII